MKFPLVLVSAFAVACLAAPTSSVQQKKPFIIASFENKCAAGNSLNDPKVVYSEDCAGTLDYCSDKGYEKVGEPFPSPKACIDSRQPPTFQEPSASSKTQDNFLEEWYAKSSPGRFEATFGTVSYCNKMVYNNTAETYANPEQCIEARQKTDNSSSSSEEADELNLNPTAPPEKPRFPPQRDFFDDNVRDSPQKNQDAICEQFQESKDKCQPVMAVGECAWKTLTLKSNPKVSPNASAS